MTKDNEALITFYTTYLMGTLDTMGLLSHVLDDVDRMHVVRSVVAEIAKAAVQGLSTDEQSDGRL